ncbi:DUF4363 family protein [Paramaledivibacter caminithermalis]|uniref:DUF4363 family protein n=1 Tax=Paramaledivibacter caminithermalis (strain DSM 15212 / CIP 107654 / DViRD3) TaxID=1121301 RepID=A0A1M6QCX7_PARC5|nr:DUF4363 family protein [Paramaledivibacter caminithermalis]SHK18038.1 protein of unknown function [Paramaledivibacter caminithermalis DSM 15212]
MKSLFISAFIVIILITSWIIIYNFIEKSVHNINSMLSEMEDKIYNNNWNSAVSIYNDIYIKWKNTKKVLMLVIEHEEMEKINLTLEKIKKYISINDKSLSIGETAALKYFLNHIREKESLSLHNIF